MCKSDVAARQFWLRVTELLEKSRQTKQDLAKATGMNYGTLTNKSSGSTYVFPNVPSALLIASALGTTVEFLMTGKEPEEKYPARIKAIADHLCTIPDQSLDIVETMVMAIPSKQDGSYISQKEA